MAVLSSALVRSGWAALCGRGWPMCLAPRVLTRPAALAEFRELGWAAFVRGSAAGQVPDDLTWSEAAAWRQGWDDARNWTRDIA